MNKVKRILKWVLISFGGLTVLLLLLIAGADRFLSSERGARWLYSEVEQPLTIKFTPDEVRYLQIGDSTKTPLLFIHGAPGELFDWLAIAKRNQLYEQYYLLIPERRGYGGTRPKRAEPSVKVQGQALLPILKAQPKPAVVFGHSYGAPMAVALGALAPEEIARIYGVSGAYDPKLEVTFGISYWINFQLFRYLLPSPIWVSNVEKLGHPQALREAIALFQSVKVPTTLIHGTADTLVPFENSTYLQALLPIQASLIALPGQEHPVHVMLPDYFVSLLLGEESVAPDARE
jgi:pimeloyl-ACP methyl ester carboxylesterase